ncbi:MAG TPA: sulfatase-like hydrolase/transferase, partial [Ramlibacter sp.]|nr:sulfatase-like hydrolase/transferase [Ramlibacter sp.]
ARLGVVSFRNAWSCGTSTAASLPCMFSDLGQARYADGAGAREGLLDVLQRAGLAVLWIDNQSGCKGVCDRVPSGRPAGDARRPACDAGECPDEVMLEGLDARIAALPRERVARGVVIVLHQMGSHGPAYHLRSPPAFKRFLPECRSAALQDCSRGEVLNAYDNSIAYTDWFLARAVEWLSRHDGDADTALLYVSDHGESLGEGNLYLHGMPYAIAPDVQKHVPWVSWFSPGFQQAASLSVDCLRRGSGARITHDSYFHSVLGLMQVRTRAYQASLDAYEGCRASA